MAIFHGMRQWVYPAESKGRFSSWHGRSAVVLFAILAFVPWMRIGGHPVFLADLPNRRINILGQVFLASDSEILLVLLLMAAFGLFFFTSLFGRVWCGYMCPQSVFMINVVYPLERWIEGSRGQQMRRDKQPWSWDKAWRKGAKWSLLVVIAWVISMSFMGFFAPAGELWTGQSSAGAYGVVAFFTGLWSFDFLWYREQTCNQICPYARFQGALTDDESLVISYDVPRGEPRGKAAKERGGCIDCNKCVVVCPQGIDIRDGYQLECIACGKCVDACTSVMDKLGHPTLVRYTTEAEEQGRTVRWIRPRTVAYGSLLSVLLVAGIWAVSGKTSLELNVDRATGSPYILDEDGFIRNTFMLNVATRHLDDEVRTYVITVDGLPEGSQVRARPVQLGAQERRTIPVIVRVPASAVDGGLPLDVSLRGPSGQVTDRTRFLGPRHGG